MCPFKTTPTLSLPPIPPTDLAPSQHKQAQDDYVTKHDKLVRPAKQIIGGGG